MNLGNISTMEMKDKPKKSRFKKIILIVSLIIILFIIFVIAFISPIAKYAIERYDVKYLGREIKTGWVYVNPFTGFVHISNVKIYESKSDSIMLSAEGINASYDLVKTLKKTYEINSLKLIKPVVYIIQNRKQFNFDDLVELFKPKDSTSIDKEPLHFNILNVEIKDGEFHYIEQSIPINYFIKNVNIESNGKRWDVDSMDISFQFKSGPSFGDIKGNCSIGFDSLNYRLSADIKKYDLKILEQYLHDLANYGNFSANLDANIKAAGNFNEKLSLRSSAFVAINDFHFGKTEGDDFASFKKLAVQAKLISPIDSTYLIDSLMLHQLFFRYERYDYLDNIQRMFGENLSKAKAASNDQSQFNLLVEIAKFVEVIAKNFIHSYYRVGKVAVYDGDIQFSDYSLREKFSIAARPLYLYADSIDRNRATFEALLRADIKPYGSVVAKLNMNPSDYENFYLSYKLMKVPVTIANPYLVTYTSFPLDRGTLDFNGYMKVVNGNIQSQNHLLIVDPRVGKRVKKKDTKWIPVPFLMSLIRERGDVIDYFIPIEGDLKNPKFIVKDVILDILTNIFIKPPSTPYLIKVKKVEKQVEKSLSLRWGMRQTDLRPLQRKFIERIANFLEKDASASITVSPMQYAEKEKEHILLFEAKKKFAAYSRLVNKQSLSNEDSIRIDKMSIKDPDFVKYLDQHTTDAMMFTIQEKCRALISESVVNSQFALLEMQREQIFKSYFKEIDVQRVRFKKNENTIPFNGFSYYTINYKGEIPDRLAKAYEQLEELNNEPPREQYKGKRKRSR